MAEKNTSTSKVLFPLKWKIVLPISIIFSATILAFYFFVTQKITEDKHIFLNDKAQSTSMLVMDIFNEKIPRIQLAVDQYLNATNKEGTQIVRPSLESLIKKFPDFIFAAIIEKVPPPEEHQGELYDEEGNQVIIEYDEKDLVQFNQSESAEWVKENDFIDQKRLDRLKPFKFFDLFRGINRKYMVAGSSRDLNHPSLAFGVTLRKKEKYLLLFVALDDLQGRMAADNVFENAVYELGGRIIFSTRDQATEPEGGKYLSKVFFDNRASAVTTLTNDEGNDVIVGHAKDKKLGIITTSTIKVSKANLLVTFLKKKLGMMGIMALSLFFLVSMLIGTMISRSLLKIQDDIMAFIDGNFEIIGVGAGRDEIGITRQLMAENIKQIQKSIDQVTKDQVEDIKKSEMGRDVAILKGRYLNKNFISEGRFDLFQSFYLTDTYGGTSFVTKPTSNGLLFGLIYPNKVDQNHHLMAYLADATASAVANLETPSLEAMILGICSTYAQALGENFHAKGFFGLMNFETQSFQFINVGANSPLLFNYDEPKKIAALTEKKDVSLSHGLGAESLESKTIQIRSNDTIIIVDPQMSQIPMKEGVMSHKGLLTLLVKHVIASDNLKAATEALDSEIEGARRPEKGKESFLALIKIT